MVTSPVKANVASPSTAAMASASAYAVALAAIPFNLVWSASVKTLESVAASTAARISAFVWSAVAFASIPSSLVLSAPDIDPAALVVAALMPIVPDPVMVPPVMGAVVATLVTVPVFAVAPSATLMSVSTSAFVMPDANAGVPLLSSIAGAAVAVAEVAMPLNLLRSEPVMMAPEPTLLTSLSSVTLSVA